MIEHTNKQADKTTNRDYCFIYVYVVYKYNYLTADVELTARWSSVSPWDDIIPKIKINQYKKRKKSNHKSVTEN